jgi:hypothetical protein
MKFDEWAAVAKEEEPNMCEHRWLMELNDNLIHSFTNIFLGKFGLALTLNYTPQIFTTLILMHSLAIVFSIFLTVTYIFWLILSPSSLATIAHTLSPSPSQVLIINMMKIEMLLFYFCKTIEDFNWMILRYHTLADALQFFSVIL